MKETVSTVAFLRRLIAGLLLIIVIVIALAAFSIHQMSVQDEEQASVTTRNLAQVLYEYISGVISKTDVALLSVRDEAEKQLAGGGINRQAINSYIARQRQRVAELDGLRITDDKGNIVYGENVPLDSPVNIADRDYFVHSRDNQKHEIFISRPVIGRITGKWSIHISRRIDNPDGSFAGMVYGSIMLEKFAGTFSRINVGPQGSIILFDNELKVICRYPEPQATGTVIGRQLASPEIRELFPKKETAATYRTTSTFDGIERTVSYRRIADYPVYILVGLARDDYLAHWRKETVQILVMASLFCLAVLCLAWLLCRYILARKRAEESLLKSEKKIKDITSSLAEGIYVLDRQGNITFMNSEAERLLGWKAEELENRNLHEVVHFCKSDGNPLPFDECPMVNVIKTGKGYCSDDENYVRKDGSFIPVSVICSPITEGTDVVSVVVAFRDMTDRKKLEEALIRSYEGMELRVIERTSELKTANDRLRSLAAHLQSVREEERTNIARDIHDELGQALTAMKMELSWFKDKYSDHKSILEKSGSMIEALDATILSVKRICTELRPSILDHFGIVAAMEWQASEFKKRSCIECTFTSECEEIDLDKQRSTVLFRIFQESLTNVLKHAQATQVTATLSCENGSVLLTVVDNGIGITDEHLSKPQAFGLIGMGERVYPWGGKVEITGEKNGGTTVKVLMPLPSIDEIK